jgi:DNA repair photolyase
MARRARGSESNPQSRFEKLRYDASLASEPPPALDPDDDLEPDPRTLLIPDPSRTIVARNDSPDVGFDASVNPYRGCEHACVYCLAPETPVLHADLGWRPLGDVRVGDALVGFDEHSPSHGPFRKLRTAVVEAVWGSRKPAFRIETASASVIATADHRWLAGRDLDWHRTDALVAGRSLRRVPVVADEPVDGDYRAGYLSGLTLAESTPRYESARAVEYLATFGIETLDAAAPGPAALERLDQIVTHEIDSRGFRRGLLGGLFDADGRNGSSLRFVRVDGFAVDRVLKCAGALGFRFEVEPRKDGASTLRLAGTVADRIRFLSTVRPAARRKLANLGSVMHLAPEPVQAVEAIGERDVVDIQTSTRTFFAAGLATHNCYARPSHEYLGWSAGLDFETKILVKHDAPALLRKALDSPRWKPATIALSGVTDAYQPAERKLGITRGVLEVLAEYRNPVAVITKSFTVTRDVDLLAELASHGAASVAISVTSLDASLQRILEPRAAPPKLRLAAIERLAKAGVPVGVMVAPIIPGLTDHEVPKILAAAAAAGAGHAGRVLLRLPHGVKELFAEWLERHFPDRKEKVLNRLRAAHGGKLYDPTFRHRQRGEGFFADQVGVLFDAARRRAGLAARGPELSTAAFRRPTAQPGLFD